jgi:hypothetical protein
MLQCGFVCLVIEVKNSDSVASCPAGSDCHWSIYMVFVGDIEACDVLCAVWSVQMWRDTGECFVDEGVYGGRYNSFWFFCF